MEPKKCESCGAVISGAAPDKTHRALQTLGILAIVVGVSLFIGSEQSDSRWTLFSVFVTCGVGLGMYAWGRFGVIGAKAR